MHLLCVTCRAPAADGVMCKIKQLLRLMSIRNAQSVDMDTEVKRLCLRLSLPAASSRLLCVSLLCAPKGFVCLMEVCQ